MLPAASVAAYETLNCGGDLETYCGCQLKVKTKGEQKKKDEMEEARNIYVGKDKRQQTF